ncbi:MAG: 1-acyl-sn-glycerol-3-phosphate acyltransferase [Gemmatimonadota bacterium]
MSFLRLHIHVFFRRVEVEGLENVPESRGGLLVAWHPNGLIDPSLIMAQSSGRVVFGARDGLFKIPVLGPMMRALGTVPIYRASDSEGDDDARRAANRTSLDALAEKIVEGSFSALFPEGLSHDEPHLMELKTGAARLYYRARQLQGAGDRGSERDAGDRSRARDAGDLDRTPVIIPVGLHYDRKHAFRSRALVQFHPPLELADDLDVSPAADEPDEEFRARARRLTGKIEEALTLVVMPTESWEVHRLFHRGRKLIRAERAARAGSTPGRPKLLEKQVGFARVWAGYRHLRHSHPAEVEALMDEVREYDANLTALQLADHELDGSPRLGSPLLSVFLIAQFLMVFGLFPPLLLLGAVVNLPAALVCVLIARNADASKDRASLKILAGSVLFPLSWVASGVLVAFGIVRLQALSGLSGIPIAAGLVTVVVGAVGALVAVSYRRLAAETVRSIRVRFTRRRRLEEIDWLRSERSRLHDRLTRLSDGLDLPGEVTEEGRIAMRRT